MDREQIAILIAALLIVVALILMGGPAGPLQLGGH